MDSFGGLIDSTMRRQAIGNARNFEGTVTAIDGGYVTIALPDGGTIRASVQARLNPKIGDDLTVEGGRLGVFQATGSGSMQSGRPAGLDMGEVPPEP